MGAQMDQPLDGRHAPTTERTFYAIGRRVWMQPLALPGRGVVIGGPVAEAADHYSATFIARRCTLFEPMLAMLKDVATAKTARLEVMGLTADEIATIMAPLRALIARAEGR